MAGELEQLMLEKQNLIYAKANQYRYGNNDIEDLKQEGWVGFMDAYNNFDASRGVKFTTYAYPYIHGTISKYSKENKGIKVSRELTKLYYKIEKASILLTQKYMRRPTTQELAEELGIDELLICECLNSKNPMKSIDEPVNSDDGSDMSLHEMIGFEDKNIDELIMLRDALKNLTAEEYQLIMSRYQQDMTQSEVANILGMSQVQVSRKEQKVLTKLRSTMMN